MTAEIKITAGSSIEQLPNDPQTLKQMVLTLLEQIDDLNGRLYYLKRQLFGKQSEKLDPAQRLLFENLYDQVKAKIDQQKLSKAPTVKKRKNANHHGRNALPQDLPREVIEIEPPDEEKICPVCHKEKERIGSEETEKLEYVPASFYVKKYVRYKFACKACESHVSIGELPPMVIDKGIPGEGLLAHIITSKYGDHLPLNRLEGILQRHGVKITVSTMCDWVGKSVDLLAPLVKRMRARILQSPLINNACESALKKAILHRKNSYFFKTPNGARVGDLYMSLIYTCELNGVNPFDYLTELQKHANELSSHPSHWMPWNYCQTLQEADVTRSQTCHTS